MYSREASKDNTQRLATQRLELLIEVEVAAVLILFLLLSLHGLLLVRAGHDAGFLVVADAFFEEVGLAGQGDGLHKVERVGRFVVFLVAEGEEETVSDEFDVLFHEVGVHAQQRAGQGLGQEFLLDGHGLGDDVLHGLLAGPFVQVGEEQAGEVGVHAFVAGDELVGEGQAWHEAAFLEPEDGGEGAAEEDAFDGREGDEALREGRIFVRDPFQGPVGLFADAGDCGTRQSVGCAYKGWMVVGLLVSMASKRYVRCFCSLMYVSMSREYVSEWIFSIMIWKP